MANRRELGVRGGAYGPLCFIQTTVSFNFISIPINLVLHETKTKTKKQKCPISQ